MTGVRILKWIGYKDKDIFLKKMILILSLFFSLPGWAAELEIKADKGTIKLPFWPAKEPIYGGVILVKGGAPAWSEFLTGLAPRLSSKGWSVLLLQASPEIKSPWAVQLPAALGALQQSLRQKNDAPPLAAKGAKNLPPPPPALPIVLLYYGDALNQVEEYRAKAFDKQIKGLILLSAYDEKASTLKLEELQLPVLDMVGQFDYDLVLSAHEAREAQNQKTDHHFMVLPGATHDYTYAEDSLVSFLVGWMKKIPIFDPLPPANAKPAGKPGPPGLHRSYIEPIYSLESSFMALN